MALLWTDGFDKYGTTDATLCTPAFIMQARYQQRQNRVYTYAGRWSGYAVTVAWNNTAWFQTPALTTDDTLIVGFSMYVPSTHGNGEIFQLRSEWNYVNETTGGISVHLNSDESITIKRGTTTLGTSAASVITENSWLSFELKLKTNNTTGTYEIRIDGTDVLSATGVDTQHHATDAFHNVVRFNGALASTVPANGVRIDHFWVCDSTGTENNDFLGAGMRVVTLSPNADGDSSDWTETPTGTHYSSLDEDEQDDTKYVEDITSGNLDLYEYESMPSLGTIAGVHSVTECKLTDPLEASLKSVVKHSTTEDADSGQVVGTDDWKCLCRMMEENPVTSSAWTKSDVDSLQAGVEVV
jgi:hypothetical protein